MLRVRTLTYTVLPKTSTPSACLSQHTRPSLEPLPIPVISLHLLLACVCRLVFRVSSPWESHWPHFPALNGTMLLFVFTPHSLHSHQAPLIHDKLPSFTLHLLHGITSLSLPTPADIHSMFLSPGGISLLGSMVPLLSSEVRLPGCFFDGCFYKNGILHAGVRGLVLSL